MGATIREAVVAAIRDHGPISFAEYMDLALYGPGGYYEHPPVGDDRDFVTAPHIHRVFAELLAVAIREIWTGLGSPETLQLTELGAGDGTLARALLGAPAMPPVTYRAVERSPGAREALSAVDGVTVEPGVPEGQHVVVANELLDNLPFRRLRLTSDGLREVRVAIGDGRLREELEPWDGPHPTQLPVGEETVIPDGALMLTDELCRKLTRGYALMIDYGAVGSPGGTTHGYRGHRMVTDPLDAPGEVDITAGVDFDLIARRAREGGLTSFESVTQLDALIALGYEDRMSEQLDRQRELLAAEEGAEAVRVWSDRSRASILVDPAGMGRFRWLLLATSGLPEPPWFADAISGLRRPRRRRSIP